MRRGHRRTLAEGDHRIPGRKSCAKTVRFSKKAYEENQSAVAKKIPTGKSRDAEKLVVLNGMTSEFRSNRKKQVARVRWKSEVTKDFFRAELWEPTLLLSYEEELYEASFAHRPLLADRWEQAEAKAELAAEAYGKQGHRQFEQPSGRNLAKGDGKALPTALQAGPVPFLHPPSGAGRPLDEGLHAAVLEFALAGPQSPPPSKGAYRHTCQRRKACNSERKAHAEVDPDSEEFKAVAKYFMYTLCSGACILGLTRIQNQRTYSRYRGDGDQTVMFHGCRSKQNEENIINNGFQVSKCTSGGRGFGTWFAYGASYSNSGFVYIDEKEVRHLFVCIVSYQHTVLDNGIMRVVGQDCAYPRWLLTYRVPNTRSRLTRSQRTVQRQQANKQAFHIVRDGCWVLESAAIA